jgi:GT2 family glycosyltransferase
VKAEDAGMSVSVCITTRNRPDELRRCLRSVERSATSIRQVIVSDDSTDDRTYRMISSEFDSAQYLKGPRKGPGANRNNAVRRATSDYVLFLDDDACLGDSFLHEARACLAQYSNHSNHRRAIVTGLYKEHGKLIYPHEQDFLGFQSVDCKNKRIVDAMVIGSVLFPRELFDELRFEELTYYDEIDLATRARARGFDILLCKSAINSHYPPEVDRDIVDPPLASASRIFVTYKRYAYTEKNPTKGVAYLLVANVHLFLSAVKRKGVAGVPEALRTVKTSHGYIRKFTGLPKGARRWVE